MAADEPGENRLLALYRRTLGEPARERDVYLGFGLFFGGIALGAVGLVVFLYGAGQDPGSDLFWQLREIALAAAFLGLPSFILSVVVLLPVGRRARFGAVGGAALCLAAVGVFVAVYPGAWNVQFGPDYSPQIIALYAAGLAVLVGVTGSALVAQYLERVRPEPVDTTAEAGGSSGGGRTGTAGEEVTEERVRRDIEESMEAAELSWGGVRKRETKRLRIKTPDVGDAGQPAQFDSGSAKTARSAGTDEAVDGLRKLRGGHRKTAAGSGTDDQLEKLRQLQSEQAAADADQGDGSVIGQVRKRLGL